jgi:hypothetical protein
MGERAEADEVGEEARGGRGHGMVIAARSIATRE